MKKIIVDLYGADKGASEVAEGVAKALMCEKDISIIVSGDEAEAKQLFESLGNKYSIDSERLEFLHAPRKITNDDSPVTIVKGGEGTSMAEALRALKTREDLCGMVSCGSTGALLVGSIFILGLKEGLKKPSLASLLPTSDGKFICLADCGSNMDCKPDELVTFAKLASDHMREVYNVKDPAVALLSVGRENHKGNLLTKDAFELLSKENINFVGNVEPDALYTGEADVIVSDGFAGNILLKNTEMTGNNILGRIEKLTSCETDEHTKEVLAKIKEEIIRTHEFNSKGGAIFLGTKKIIVKGHGAASSDTVCSCILQILGKNQFFARESQ